MGGIRGVGEGPNDDRRVNCRKVGFFPPFKHPYVGPSSDSADFVLTCFLSDLDVVPVGEYLISFFSGSI